MLRRDCEGAREGHEEGSRFVSKSLSCFLSRVARHYRTLVFMGLFAYFSLRCMLRGAACSLLVSLHVLY